MGSGQLDPDINRDILVVGSPSSLMGFDVYSNTDVFNSDVRDGVFSMTIGSVDVNENPTNLALVGGNCSILGFDHKGDDVFWTVSGDNVSAIEFYLNEQKQKRILVGSEDYAIRIYNSEEMLFEINESAKVTNFTDLGQGRYGYSLDNGGVGVYKGTHRQWKAKAKHKVISLACGDLLEDGVPALIIGWSNGKVELRSERKGEEIFKKLLKQPIAKVFFDDYRLEGKKKLMAITTSGKIVGFSKENATAEVQSEQIEDLHKKKISLLNEIQSAKDSNKAQNFSVPDYTSLSVSFESNPTSMILSANNNTYIKCAILLCEGLFENDLKFFHPAKPMSEVKIPITTTRYKQNEIEIKVLIGASLGAQQFQVFERKVILPKYCNFQLKSCPLPSGSVHFEFRFGENLLGWIKEKFLIVESELLKITDRNFMFYGANECIHIVLNRNILGIFTDTIDLAGEIIQDLSVYFTINELNSTAKFPEEIGKIKALLEKIDDFNAVRTQLTVNMAENCQNVKALIVKAEDARIQRDMTYFKQNLSSLHQFNGELLGEYQIRANNHTELLNCLKIVNQYIQRSGNLRCGTSKAKTISLLRDAVKARNIENISRIISSGN